MPITSEYGNYSLQPPRIYLIAACTSPAVARRVWTFWDVFVKSCLEVAVK
jgi:hypothetical protein